MAYDEQNVFAKILRGEIPAQKVHEDDHVLAFKDINPQRKVHVLVIPKGSYTDMDDFTENASDSEIATFYRSVGKIARDLGLAEDGYRLITNCKAHGHQEVPHLHVHIIGGEPAGPMLKPA